MRARKVALDLLLSLLTIGVITGFIGGVLNFWTPGNLNLLYILGILGLAAARGRTAAMLGSMEAFLASDWFFVPPFHQWTVEQPLEWLSLGIFLVVALVTGQAYALQRRQAIQVAEHDRRTQLLYDLSTDMTTPTDLGSRFDRMLERLAHGLNLAGLRLYVRRGSRRELVSAVETVPGALASVSLSVRSVPCRIGDQDLAEMEALSALEWTSSEDDVRVLQGFANQLANALERRRLEKEEQLNQVLTEANRAKTGLLAAVSHDLRTPLAAIKASATSLLHDGTSFDQNASREFLESISHEADRLDRLVSNLLDMSRIESGALVPRREWHNLSEIAADVIDRLQPVAEGHEIRLIAEDREYLSYVDFVQISQILTNLVANAIRFALPRTAVRVCVSEAGFRVENDGPLLSEEELTRIFDPFYRGSDQASGTGLGLAIARGLAEAHGGSICAENTATGVAFKVALPREPAEEKV